MDAASLITTETALTQQNIALSVIKNNAQMEKAIANILDQSLSVGPAQRGGSINVTA